MPLHYALPVRRGYRYVLKTQPFLTPAQRKEKNKVVTGKNTFFTGRFIK